MLIHPYSTEKTKETLHKGEPLPLDRVAVVILGGGVGKRLHPLTKNRCKPAISFGGRYSLIDVPISHSFASGLNNIYIIGQYLSYSLQKHLFQTYLSSGPKGSQLQLLVPEEREGERIWFNGTADAIRKNLGYFEQLNVDYFLILSGDQLYNIDFQHMIRKALEADASLLIAAQPVKKKEAKRMGLMKLDSSGSKLVQFCEKPQDEMVLRDFRVSDESLKNLGLHTHEEKQFLGSMGIYFFKKEALFNLLRNDNRDDFGKHLILTEMKSGNVHAYLYEGYWEDIGTIESYYLANLALTAPLTDPRRGLSCYDDRNQLITKTYHLPGTQISHCKLHKALICEGTIIEAEEISHSVIGVRSKVGVGSVIRDSILMGNEYYQKGNISPGIRENCLISKAIIDENVVIGRGVKLINQNGYEEFDSPEGNLYVREGIIVIPKGTTIPDNFHF